jgi:very-short-patch-repair endonuclease
VGTRRGALARARDRLPRRPLVSPMLSRWAKLYGSPTPAEAAIEPAIAELGVPYRFQHPLWALRVFPDFVLTAQKLVIEVDDPSHHTAAGRRKDAERTEKLTAAGWRVVRCKNDEALRDPRGAVRRMLLEADLGHLIKE